MVPTSPISLTPEKRYHRSSRLQWTPPGTDSESGASMSNPRWSQQSSMRELGWSGAAFHERPNHHPHSSPARMAPESEHALQYNSIPRQKLALSSFQFGGPLMIGGDARHNDTMSTTAVSTVRSSHHHKRELVATVTPTDTNSRREGTKSDIASFMSSRSASLPSLSTSSRRHRIYVRIRRIRKEKTSKLKQVHIQNQIRFDQSIPMPGVQMKIVNHFHHHHHHSQAIRDRDEMGHNEFTEMCPIGIASPLNKYSQNGGVIDGNDLHPLSRHSISEEKLAVTRSLLNIETGPIAWSLIEEKNAPVDSFVSYLTRVLTEEVQLYLEHNTGKEYWIKHIVFWNDLLDPASHWWNTKEGSLYNDIVRKLHSSLHRRWGNAAYVECSGNSRIQSLFVRACILFARKDEAISLRL